MAKRSFQLSRAISHALRHRPDLYGLELDEAGWVSIESLLTGLAREGRAWSDLTAEDIHAVAAAAEKQRFEIRAGRIRALYGHSTAKRIERVAAGPPDLLYHGTTPVAATQVLAEGLRPMRRQYVHLSPDVETADRVARRRTATPVILTVLSGRAHRDGIAFYPGNDLVWLSGPIPAAYLRRAKDDDG